LLAQVPATSLADASVSAGITYQYRVSAFNSAGSSAWTTSGMVVAPKFSLGGSTSAPHIVSSGGQAGMIAASRLPQRASGTVLDYFLAPRSSLSSANKGAVSLSPVAEKWAQKSAAAIGPSVRLRAPVPAADALELSGQLSAL
jgi:hypothetical protein